MIRRTSEKPPLTAGHLIADFLHLQASLGRRPKLSYYLRHCHTPKVLDRVFGRPGWRRLLGKIGKRVMPKQYLLDEEHLIRDYLDTEQAIGRKPGYSHFHARHRHGVKVLNRVFGNAGWTRLGKAADSAKKKKSVFVEEQRVERTARTEREILKDIRAVYRGLSRINRTAGGKQITEKAWKKAVKLRRKLLDLFHEAGRAISVEEAFEKRSRKAPRACVKTLTRETGQLNKSKIKSCLSQSTPRTTRIYDFKTRI